MPPIAATVAGAEPESAPKNAQANTATIAMPPGIQPTNLSKNLISLLLIPPLDISAPASTNNGIASSENDPLEANIACATAFKSFVLYMAKDSKEEPIKAVIIGVPKISSAKNAINNTATICYLTPSSWIPNQIHLVRHLHF